ncbi:MAG: hypothetical protein HC910_21540 [Spirulinaceae cyanobacterium SM2_1_0]|nr:hypothetical protein [Spirulinaceae cyanobacterium SM2_1_0]
MPLPPQFSYWEHLQSTLAWIHNRNVRDEFRDLGDTWEPDISTGRSSLRMAATIQDNDTSTMVLLRLFFFYFILRRAQDLQPPIYGIPVASYQTSFKFHPQVQLHFKQDALDHQPNENPVTGRLSYRLIEENSQTLTKGQTEVLANRIATEFGFGGNGYVWRKGRDLVSYYDPDHGVNVQVLALNLSEGREVISKLLDLQNLTPNWELSNHKQNQDAPGRYPTVPPLKNILGDLVRMPRRRPVANVRFTHAELHLYGLGKPVVLYDRTDRYLGALVRA